MSDPDYIGYQRRIHNVDYQMQRRMRSSMLDVFIFGACFGVISGYLLAKIGG